MKNNSNFFWKPGIVKKSLDKKTQITDEGRKNVIADEIDTMNAKRINIEETFIEKVYL